MNCEKKEALIRKGLLRNQQPRVFMSNARKLIDLLVNSKTTTEEIMKSVDKWIADYDPAWYQLEAQLPAMQEQDRFLYERFVNWCARLRSPLSVTFAGRHLAGKALSTACASIQMVVSRHS